MCITFGAPLAADKILADALRSTGWDARFLHIVGRHDIVPRVLLQPGLSKHWSGPETCAFSCFFGVCDMQG